MRARGGAERRAPPAERPEIRATRWRRLGGAAAAGRRRPFVLAKCGIRFGANDGEVGRSRRTNDDVAAAAPAALVPLLLMMMLLLRPPAAPAAPGERSAV